MLHPDRGGSHSQMTLLNSALEEALRSGPATTDTTRPSKPSRVTRTFASRDVSSFTISCLPVDAFETMTLVAAHCGQLTDDEPPYVIEFTMAEANMPGLADAICRCELMPEAGATTVHLGISGGAQVPIESVRDLLVGIINELDC